MRSLQWQANLLSRENVIKSSSTARAKYKKNLLVDDFDNFKAW